MIPYARIAGFLTAKSGGKLQVQILSIEENALVIRTAQPVDEIRQMKLHIYDDRSDCFDAVVLPAPVRYTCRREAFCVVYTFQVDDEDYRAAVRKLDVQYSHYVMRKLKQDDAALAEDYTGYPAELDERITTDFTGQRNRWYEETMRAVEKSCFMPVDSDAKKGVRAENRWIDRNNQPIEIALELDNPKLWAQYEALPIQMLWKDYWEAHQLAQHPFASCVPNGIYIGNQFCHLLFPEWKQMKRMLDKAKQEKLNVSIMTTYLREDAIDAMRDRLELLYAWCETNRTPVEVVANDWGTLVLLTKKRPWLIPSMGVLLNKRRKDPRMKYKTGFADEEGTLAENSLNEAFYRDYLKETYGLTHFEQEACGYRIVPPKGHNRLHVPYELGRYDVWGMRYSFCENDAAYPKNGQNMTIMQSHEVCGGEQEIAPQDNEGDEETYEDDYLTGATGCGLCALYDLADAGITHLKLVGRGNFSEYMKLDILKTRKALEILEEMRGAGRDAYRKEMRAVLFTGRCSQNCYYR